MLLLFQTLFLTTMQYTVVYFIYNDFASLNNLPQIHILNLIMLCVLLGLFKSILFSESKKRVELTEKDIQIPVQSELITITILAVCYVIIRVVYTGI